MADDATLRTWLEGMEVDGVVVEQRDPETWEVVHDRRVPESVLSSDWHAPWDNDPPAAVVGAAAREVACGFPLVESETRNDGGDLALRFRALVFDEGLSRQGFVLTVSAVLKAAQVFDLVLARRADEVADWREFEADSERRKQEQEELIKKMTEAGEPSEATAPVAPVAPAPSPDDTVPAAEWSPTHDVRRRAKAWAQPDPAGASAGTLARRVPVQVMERQGDWARVVTSNGWTGWVDSHDLKAR